MIKLLLAFLLLLRLDAFAGDTTLVKEAITMKSLGATITEGTLLLQSRNLKFRFAAANSPFKFLLLPDTVFTTVKFKKCYMGTYGGYSLPYEPENIMNKRLEFDSCELKYLNIPKVSGETVIYNSRIGVIAIDSSVNLSLRITSNQSLQYLVADHCQNFQLDVQRTHFNDSAFAKVLNSSISQFNFGLCKTGGSEFQFIEDTLNGSMGVYEIIDQSYKEFAKTYPYKNIFRFSHCVINSRFVFFEEVPHSSFIFENCVFGPDADLRDMQTEKLYFSNCRFPEKKTPLNVTSNAEQIELGFINSDVENIRMNLVPGNKIVFDTGYNYDVITNSYERLYNKFKSEGKNNSAQIVDIQYHQFKDAGWWSFLQKAWWNYGYNKFLVVYWAVGFLLLFFVINYKYWLQMNTAYPIVPLNTKAKKSNRLLVLFFTVFVFFALRISLDKLNFDKQRYVILFFVQYLTGIWFLFFILKAVLKF